MADLSGENARCAECDGPLDGDGWHQSEWADCTIAEYERNAAEAEHFGSNRDAS